MALDNTNRFSITCKICEEEVDLIQESVDDFRCPTCNTTYSSEDGVLDHAEAEEMYRLYKGAKLAGLIKDEETYEEFFHD